jgi:hypothetical protein
MSLWTLIVLFALIKLPLAAVLLWLPFRDDAAMHAPAGPATSEEDGGSRTLSGSPPGPRPRWPIAPRPRGPGHRALADGPARPYRHRDPHGARPPRAPRRVRAPLTPARRQPTTR